MADKSKIIFNNPMSAKDYKKALQSKKKFLKKYGDDSKAAYSAKESMRASTRSSCSSGVSTAHEAAANKPKAKQLILLCMKILIKTHCGTDSWPGPCIQASSS